VEPNFDDDFKMKNRKIIKDLEHHKKKGFGDHWAIGEK
jgi:hypothetical protein